MTWEGFLRFNIFNLSDLISASSPLEKARREVVLSRAGLWALFCVWETPELNLCWGTLVCSVLASRLSLDIWGRSKPFLHCTDHTQLIFALMEKPSLSCWSVPSNHHPLNIHLQVLSSSPTWSFLFAVEYQYFSWRRPWGSSQVKEASHAGGKFAPSLKVTILYSTPKESIQFEAKWNKLCQNWS